MIQDYSLRLRIQVTVTDYGSDYAFGLRSRTTFRITIRTTFSDYDMTYRSPSTGYALVYKELVHVLSYSDLISSTLRSEAKRTVFCLVIGLIPPT